MHWHSISPTTLYDGSMNSGDITIDGLDDWLVVGVWCSASVADSAIKECICYCSVSELSVAGGITIASDTDMRWLGVKFKRNGNNLTYSNFMYINQGSGEIQYGRKANGIVGLIRK